MPLIQRKLTGDDNRPMSAINQVEQVFAFAGREASANAEVVENEQSAAIEERQTRGQVRSQN